MERRDNKPTTGDQTAVSREIKPEPQKPRLDSVQRKWSRREETDFLKTIWNFGVLYDPEKQTFEWTKFKLLSKLEKKIDEAMTEYYKSFINMCKRQCGQKVEDESEIVCEAIDPEKARRTLERVELLSKIREETLSHPQLDERLKLCQPSADIPDWWICGKHDRDLLIGVAKHGLGRSDYHILNDPELSFHEILHKQYSAINNPESKLSIKLESPEGILKFDNKNEIVVKLEKGEGTLKIEKVIKKESEETSLLKKEKPNAEKEDKEDEKKSDSEGKSADEKNNSSKNPKEQSSEDVQSKADKKKETEPDSDIPERRTTRSKRRQEEYERKKEEDVKKQTDEVSKQAAELKAMFPDLEVIQPLSRLSQIDTYVLRDKPGGTGVIDFSETTVAQMFNNAIKWPKEYALQMRLQHIVHTVEHGEWPAPKTFTAYTSSKNSELDIAVYDTPNVTPKRDTSTPMSTSEGSEIITITTDHGVGVSSKIKTNEQQLQQQSNNSASKKRKRHIAIDVETERAKLHALLNSTANSGQSSTSNTVTSNLSSQVTISTPIIKPSPTCTWPDNDDSEESRRSTPVTQPVLQPPPAHQQVSRILSMPFDLKYQGTKLTSTPISANISPSSSSSMAPMDLSSGRLPKMNTPDIPKVTIQQSNIQNEVQDFSMSSKKATTSSSTATATITPTTSNTTAPSTSGSSSGKGKLDDMLNKLMKKKNAPELEPVTGGKEKKRRKLDEIVLGLSAAKEQSLMPETPKKITVTPSVTVTPTSLPPATTTPPTQKPFTITVTSVPSPVPSSSRSSSVPSLIPPLPTSKDSFTTFLQQAEQQNLLLKKQQQLLQQAAQTQLASPSSRKSYEQMIADINKVSDFSSKINSYSHEAKVNKWLAEQNSVVAEQPLSADFLSAPRRRRPRVDPSLLDWKKLTGEENVSVVHRVSGKKLTGSKAPPLKRLGQWLIENPMYDIDPKWADLVKERGNLTHDLQKRLPGSSKKGPGRPPLLGSPTGTTPVSSAANLATSMASNLSFPSLSTAGLSGLNNSLLSGLSLGQFDPKTNPLLMPFAGMPNMNALSSLGGLGNLGNMNLFANLASLGLPGLVGMDGASAAAALGVPTSTTTSMPESNTPSSSATTTASSSKQKSRKNTESQSSSNTKPPPVSAASASSIPTTTPFPFFFPNPSLLYTPLGLGGLNPFSMQPGMSTAFDTLAQQCGLLNGMGLSSAATTPHTTSSTKASSKSHGSRTSSTTQSSSTVTSSSTKTSHSSSSSNNPRSAWEQLDRAQQVQLQQLLLPHDTHLLESLSRAPNMEAVLRASSTPSEKRSKEDKKETPASITIDFAKLDKRKSSDSFSSASLLTDYSMMSDKFLKSSLPSSKHGSDHRSTLDLSKSASSISIYPPPESPSTKRSREQELKEALEHLSKTQAELIAKPSELEEFKLTPSNLPVALKRPREVSAPEDLSSASITVEKIQDEPPPKKVKDRSDSERTVSKTSTPSSTPTPTPTPLTIEPQIQVRVQTPQPQPPVLIPPTTTVNTIDDSGEVDIEALLTPSTVVKGGCATPLPVISESDRNPPPPVNIEINASSTSANESSSSCTNQSESKQETSLPSSLDETKTETSENNTNNKKPAPAGRRTRGSKRKSGEEIEVPVIERKNLRSSAGRAAAAAAARAAAEQAKQAEEAENAKNNESTISANKDT